MNTDLEMRMRKLETIVALCNKISRLLIAISYINYNQSIIFLLIQKLKTIISK